MSTLTKRAIEAALGTGVEKTRILWDDSPKGLGLKLRPTGAASWVYVFRPRGAARGTPSRTLTLGSWPALAVDAARAAARGHAAQVALGNDPAAMLRTARNRRRRGLANALAEYEMNLRRRQIVNAANIMSTLRRGLSPYLGREVTDLERADFIARIDGDVGKLGRQRGRHADLVLPHVPNPTAGAAPC